MESQDVPVIYTVTYTSELPMAKSTVVRVYDSSDLKDLIANPRSLTTREYLVDETAPPFFRAQGENMIAYQY